MLCRWSSSLSVSKPSLTLAVVCVKEELHNFPVFCQLIKECYLKNMPNSSKWYLGDLFIFLPLYIAFKASMVSGGHDVMLMYPNPPKEQMKRGISTDDKEARSCSVPNARHIPVTMMLPSKLDISICFSRTCSQGVPTASRVESDMMSKNNLDPLILVFVSHYAQR